MVVAVSCDHVYTSPLEEVDTSFTHDGQNILSVLTVFKLLVSSLECFQFQIHVLLFVFVEMSSVIS